MNPTPGRFTVQLVGQVGDHLEGLAVLSEKRGLQGLLAEVLRQILENLETRPREWGDPYTNFRAMKAVAYGRTVFLASMRVEYAVHDTEPLVWISSVRPLSGSPFA